MNFSPLVTRYSLVVTRQSLKGPSRPDTHPHAPRQHRAGGALRTSAPAKTCRTCGPVARTARAGGQAWMAHTGQPESRVATRAAARAFSAWWMIGRWRERGGGLSDLLAGGCILMYSARFVMIHVSWRILNVIQSASYKIHSIRAATESNRALIPQMAGRPNKAQL